MNELTKEIMELTNEAYKYKKECERKDNIINEIKNRMKLKINRHYNEKQYVVCIADLEELFDKIKELENDL